MPALDSPFKTTKCNESRNSKGVATDSKSSGNINGHFSMKKPALRLLKQEFQKHKNSDEILLALKDNTSIEDLEEADDLNTPYRYTFKKAVRRVSNSMVKKPIKKFTGQKEKTQYEETVPLPKIKKKIVRFNEANITTKEPGQDKIDLYTSSADGTNDRTGGTKKSVTSSIRMA